MALTLRTNGNNPINIIQASWFNDFYNLLTGAMNDQPVSLKYTPAAGNAPALTITSKAGNALLRGYLPDGVTQAFQFDENGNLAVGSALTVNAAGGNVITAQAVGAGYAQIYFHSKDNATPEFGWTMDSRPASPLAIQITRQGVNGFTFADIFHVDLNGNMLVPAGAGIPTTRNGSAVSVPIYTGTSTPVNPPTGSIWIKA